MDAVTAAEAIARGTRISVPAGTTATAKEMRLLHNFAEEDWMRAKIPAEFWVGVERRESHRARHTDSSLSRD